MGYPNHVRPHHQERLVHPICVKSGIVVLGNHKDRVRSKSNKFTPVLCQDSLWFLSSMAVASCCPLHQGDCKNTFCQDLLPPNEITIVHPPSGNPKAAPDEYWLLKRTLYGLRRSRGTGIKNLTQFFVHLGSPPRLKTSAFTLATFVTLPILLSHYPRHLFPSEFMSTTLSTFCKIPRSKICSVVFLRNAAKSTLWGLWNGV